jgi:hypothetical protein
VRKIWLNNRQICSKTLDALSIAAIHGDCHALKESIGDFLGKYANDLPSR